MNGFDSPLANSGHSLFSAQASKSLGERHPVWANDIDGVAGQKRAGNRGESNC